MANKRWTGAKIYDHGPKLSEARLSEVKKEIGHRLTDDYRAFMLKCNGGRPDPDVFHLKCLEGFYTDSSVDGFMSIHEGALDFIDCLRECRSYLLFSDSLIAIASDPGSNLICLSLAGADAGYVYFRDHEQEEEFDTSFPRESDLIAHSFSEFLDGLQVPPEEDPVERQMSDILYADDTASIEQMLKSGWMVDTVLQGGMTMLEAAVIQKKMGLIKVLLEHHAKVGKALETAQLLQSVVGTHQKIIGLLTDARSDTQ